MFSAIVVTKFWPLAGKRGHPLGLIIESFVLKKLQTGSTYDFYTFKRILTCKEERTKDHQKP
jgi:hypothetical protein